jgi:hypothetical protein
MKAIQVSEARARLGAVWNAAVYEREIRGIVKKGARGGALLLGSKDVVELLPGIAFHPVYGEHDGGVSLWLAEFSVYAEGDTREEAEESLLEEVRDYVEMYLGDLAFRQAPNRRPHFRHVVAAYVANLDGRLRETLLAHVQQAKDEPAASAVRDLATTG